MSAAKDGGLSGAYVELNKFCSSGDYERALKAAGKILQISPNEQKAFHCKIICLIHLLNFKEALVALTNQKNATVAADLYFEKAYVQYRLNYAKEALQTVDSAPELTPALKELRAQILYRLEKYQDCYNLYRDIVKNTSDDYEDERKANISAVLGNIGVTNPSAELPQFGDSTYELCYNEATALALRGRYADALPILKKAEQKCRESILEDGGTEDEAREEAAIIRAQYAYCLQMLGREKEAAQIYHELLKDKPSDRALVAIVSNNIVAINKEANVFDSRKRMKAAAHEELEHKLNSRQRATILSNQAIVAIYSNQPEYCKQCCVKLSKEWGQPEKACLLEACSLSRQDKVAQAVAMLSQHESLTLPAVQLLLQQGDRKGAVKMLEGGDLKYKPGVIGLLITLYNADNELKKASEFMKDVYEHYKKDKSAASSLASVWRLAATVHARAGDTAAAARAHELLASAAPEDPRTLARLVKALLTIDPARARQLAAKLPPVEELEGEIDVEALENSNWMMGAKVVKKQTKQEQSPGTPGSELGQKKKEKKRKRKTKLPPNADLSRPPDPERWLPKHERTAFRKRRGGRRPDVIKGSQGMTTAATDQYDMSKQTPSSDKGKSPRVEVKQSSGEAAWQRKQQQKKKGKKKW